MQDSQGSRLQGRPAIKLANTKNDKAINENNKKLAKEYYNLTGNKEPYKGTTDEELAYWITQDDGYQVAEDSARANNKDFSKFNKLVDEWYANNTSSINTPEEIVKAAYGKTVQEAIEADDRKNLNIGRAVIATLSVLSLSSLLMYANYKWKTND